MSHTPTETVSKHISVDMVRVGMFLEDVFDKDGVLLMSANAPVANAEQIQKLRSRGVRSLFINIVKGVDVDTTAASTKGNGRPAGGDVLGITRETAYYEELERAVVVQKEAMAITRRTLESIRNGKPFSPKDMRKAAEDIVGSILRNPDALVSLTQIKGYDEYTYTHSLNVGILMASLAHSMGYTGDRLIETGMGGLLHDAGKMKVPPSVLNKPGKFTDIEFKIMKKHPELGVQIIDDRKADIPSLVRTVILQHHERFDGNGYPYGLKGDQITEPGVIAAVADVYDALTSDRVYRAAWTPQKALALIFQGRDKEYARRIVELFTAHLGIYPTGSFVKLANGEMGVVVRVDRGNLLAPVVQVLFDNAGRRMPAALERNLAVLQKGPDGGRFKIEMSMNPKAFRVKVEDYIRSGPLLPE